MSRGQMSREEVRIRISNVGGITEADVTFDPGVTILTGRNATNRTSFLRATMAALGSDDATLKGDAEEGEVSLEIEGETHTRRLSRKGGTVAFDGDPYLEDSERADLFAFLLESNEARRAVRTSGDLGEIIVRPIDTEEIETRIDDAKRRRREVEDRIEELRELERRLPDLEERRRRIERDIEEKTEELDETRDRIEEADVSVEATRTAKNEFERKLDELSEARTELQSTESRLENRRRDLEDLENEREHLEEELEATEPASDQRLAELDRRLSSLRTEKGALDTTVNELQSIVRFNQNTLDDADSDVFAALGGEDDDSVTDRLVEDRVTCWTCGTRVEESQIEESLDRLRDLRNRKMERRAELDDEISGVQKEKAELEERERQHGQLGTRLDRIESEIESKRDAIESSRATREQIRERVAELESEVESFELEGREEILELHTRANRLEFEAEELESDLERVRSEIADAEEAVAELDDLQERREDIGAEISDLRTRVDSIVESAVEEFNAHMESVLEVLGYENLDRIWLERRYPDGSDDPTTELHVVRTSAEGTSYEDTIDHLSESEREVVGLVFSLAGYIAHAVYEDVPFIILDSLEAIDAPRLSALVDYLDQFSSYLLVALLPEDAAELDEDYGRIRDI